MLEMPAEASELGSPINITQSASCRTLEGRRWWKCAGGKNCSVQKVCCYRWAQVFHPLQPEQGGC